MKRYFDRNDKLLQLGDIVRFRFVGQDRVGKITAFGSEKSPYQNYDTAYIASIEGNVETYMYGSWEATCILEKVSDEELMLYLLEN